MATTKLSTRKEENNLDGDVNSYGLPEEKLALLRERDRNCVYCHKAMTYPWSSSDRSNSATIEHLNHLPPWDNIETVAYCCGSCNSSRGAKTHAEWFKTDYCIRRGINEESVAEPVKHYLSSL